MSPKSVALNRFGLGYREGTPQPDDPRSWLHDQISNFDPVPAALAARGNSAENIDAELQEYERLSRMMRQSRGDEKEAAKVQSQRMNERREQRLTYVSDAALRAQVASESTTPFMERIVHFWANHFAVGRTAVLGLAGVHEFGGIRPNVAGSFADLLAAAALHPAMILYLTQQRSIGPNSVVGKRRSANAGKGPGLNENLAREILELHTLGVGGGYTQADVTEFARALTGWTVGGLRRPGDKKDTGTGAVFVADLHEPGARRLLGKTYGEGGTDQVFEILADLAVHPSTARFVATKLARHFGGDNPPSSMVARLENAFKSSGGDLPTVYAAIIESPEAWVEAPLKFRQPWEWFIGTLRAGGVKLVPPRRVAGTLDELGQGIWRPTSPAGYDDRTGSWLAPDALFRRASLAEQASQRAKPVDVRQLAEAMFPGSVSEQTMSAIKAAESYKMALALLFMSPEMLRR